MYAAKTNKKMNWTKKSTLNPKPEDLSVPPGLWKLLDDNIKRTIIVLRKMYQDDKRNTNADNKEAIDTEKKQYDGNIKTFFSTKKTEMTPTQILKRTAQQATRVSPVSNIQLENQYDEHFDFNFDDYEDDSKIHPCMVNCI